MKNYAVSVIVTTTQMRLAELSEILGVEGDPGSYDIGTRRRTIRNPEQTLNSDATWIMYSEEEKDATLDEHIESVLGRVPLARISDERLPPDVEATLRIGVFFNTPMSSVWLKAEHVRVLGENGMDIDIRCYPCNDDEPEDSDSEKEA